MPSKNIIRNYDARSFYHIYNRGVEKRKIFLEDEDYIYFMELLRRHLSPHISRDFLKREYANYYEEIELLAYCLMPNHFHLLIYVDEALSAPTDLMRSVATAYTMYFNRKYKRVGHLYQGPFKASRVSNQAYLEHVSRYIHLNPKEYVEWPYSSYKHYIGEQYNDWIRPQRILDIFDGSIYEDFMADFTGHKNVLEELKYELANR